MTWFVLYPILILMEKYFHGSAHFMEKYVAGFLKCVSIRIHYTEILYKIIV